MRRTGMFQAGAAPRFPGNATAGHRSRSSICRPLSTLTCRSATSGNRCGQLAGQLPSAQRLSFISAAPGDYAAFRPAESKELVYDLGSRFC